MDKNFKSLAEMLFGDNNFPQFSSEVKSVSGTKGVNKYNDEWGAHFEFAFPGCKKDEVTVKFEDGVLKIEKADCKCEECKDRKYEIKTIDYYSYTVSVDPDEFDVEKTNVSLENGMLYVAIPAKEEKKPKSMTFEVK